MNTTNDKQKMLFGEEANIFQVMLTLILFFVALYLDIKTSTSCMFHCQKDFFAMQFRLKLLVTSQRNGLREADNNQKVLKLM